MSTPPYFQTALHRAARAIFLKSNLRGFSGGAVDGNLPANAWGWSLVREDAACLRASRPMRHNYWSPRLEPMLCNKRSHRNEKPSLTTTRESPHKAKDPARPKVRNFLKSNLNHVILLLTFFSCFLFHWGQNLLAAVYKALPTFHLPHSPPEISTSLAIGQIRWTSFGFWSMPTSLKSLELCTYCCLFLKQLSPRCLYVWFLLITSVSAQISVEKLPHRSG